jgi:hypothetical protein
VSIRFGVEHAFEGGLHRGAQESAEVVNGLGLGGDVEGELLGLEFQRFVHERISVRKEA